MDRMTHARMLRIRRTPGATVLLFLTDRCPVGCAHCSVDSRPDGPRPGGTALLAQIVDRLCADPALTTVGVSGGEPFVERRALTLAAERITAAGKDLVVYTSGVWAGAGGTPRWIHDVLERCRCIYLSTDAHHEAAAGPGRFVRAAQAVASHGLPLVVQVVDEEGALARARELLHAAFGDAWPQHAEVVPTRGLPHGRGAGVYRPADRTAGRDLGRCTEAATPVVRYDGRVTACCNETVLMGGGPAGLRRECADGDEVGAAVTGFRAAPLYRALGAVGGGGLTAHPAFADLADRRFTGICGLCWEMTRRAPTLGDDPLLRALGFWGRGEPA